MRDNKQATSAVQTEPKPNFTEKLNAVVKSEDDDLFAQQAQWYREAGALAGQVFTEAEMRLLVAEGHRQGYTRVRSLVQAQSVIRNATKPKPIPVAAGCGYLSLLFLLGVTVAGSVLVWQVSH